MAVERKINKDIANYKTKLIGPFTLRQIVCLVPAIGVAVLFLWGLKDVFPSIEARIYMTIPVAVPFILFGWVKIYNQPLEKFLKTALVSMFLSPAKRKYKTTRDDGSKIPAVNKKSAIAKTKKKSKQKTLKMYL